jgi:hypothetical protein
MKCYQSAGSKGLAREVERSDRAPRPRGIQLRGRATAETGRPPILGLVQRRDKADQDAPAAQVYLEVLENVRTATIKPITLNFSEFVVGCSWQTCARVSRDKALLFSRDWRRNRGEILSVSASVYALQTAIN